MTMYLRCLKECELNNFNLRYLQRTPSAEGNRKVSGMPYLEVARWVNTAALVVGERARAGSRSGPQALQSRVCLHFLIFKRRNVDNFFFFT